jgi:hypothetical protein
MAKRCDKCGRIIRFFEKWYEAMENIKLFREL